MSWFPNTGWLPTLGHIWPAELATTSVTLTAVAVLIRLAGLAIGAWRDRGHTVSVPVESLDLISEDQEETRAAA